MDARHPPLIDPDAGDVPGQLDRLAWWVADRLDRGDDTTAWAVTVALEALDGRGRTDDPRPPAPVIGRRFAAAHRRLLIDGVRPQRARPAA